MSRYERHEIPLDTGVTLHQISNEDRLYGYLAIGALGVRIWRATGPDHFRPTEDLFPGLISAVRALVRGEV